MAKAEDILKEDGSLKGVGLSPASGNRKGALTVRTHKDKNVLTTMFTIEGKDFFEVYQKAVDAIAGLHGIGKKSKLYSQMGDSISPFLANHGLKLEAVKVHRVVAK